MMYNITIQCPDCISMTDANYMFKNLVTAIQDLELEIADLQHGLSMLARPDETDQIQLYGKYSYMPDLIKDPVLCRFLAFNDISIEDWQQRIDQHMLDLAGCANGEAVVATDII